MNTPPKIREGYEFVLDQPIGAFDDHSPSAMYNVPNPASDVAQDVSVAEIREAIQQFSRISTEQAREFIATPKSTAVKAALKD